jgi:hypothetical protein
MVVFPYLSLFDTGARPSIVYHHWHYTKQAVVGAVDHFEIRETNCPPESGGQHDRDEVAIVRGVVPKPHPYKVRLGTTPRGIRFAIPLPS